MAELHPLPKTNKNLITYETQPDTYKPGDVPVLSGVFKNHILPKPCTLENEQYNFLFHINILCKKKKASSFTDEVK